MFQCIYRECSSTLLTVPEAGTKGLFVGEPGEELRVGVDACLGVDHWHFGFEQRFGDDTGLIESPSDDGAVSADYRIEFAALAPQANGSDSVGEFDRVVEFDDGNVVAEVAEIVVVMDEDSSRLEKTPCLKETHGEGAVVQLYLEILDAGVVLGEEVLAEKDGQGVGVDGFVGVDACDAVRHRYHVLSADERSPADVLGVGAFGPVERSVPRPFPFLSALPVRDERLWMRDHRSALHAVYHFCHSKQSQRYVTNLRVSSLGLRSVKQHKQLLRLIIIFLQRLQLETQLCSVVEGFR